MQFPTIVCYLRKQYRNCRQKYLRKCAKKHCRNKSYPFDLKKGVRMNETYHHHSPFNSTHTHSPYRPPPPQVERGLVVGGRKLSHYTVYTVFVPVYGSQERLIVGWLPGTIYPPKHRCLYFLRHKGRQLAKHFSSL